MITIFSYFGSLQVVIPRAGVYNAGVGGGYDLRVNFDDLSDIILLQESGGCGRSS
jgi:hypothetical protein